MYSNLVILINGFAKFYDICCTNIVTYAVNFAPTYFLIKIHILRNKLDLHI